MSRSPMIFGLLLAGSLWGAGPALSQQVEIPLNGQAAPSAGAAGQVVPPAPKVFDLQHLKDRPYSGTLPAPAFPSAERVQRSFTVAYVYDYAISNYTPAVDLPIVLRGQAKRDTPEAAATAFFSAQRNADWDAFLKCWTDEDAKRIQEMLKAQNVDVATLLAKWKQFYGKKPVQLYDRIETAGYVILDVRIPGPTVAQLPVVFKLVKAEWLATNDLGETSSPILSAFRPDLAGIIQHVQPVPVAQLGGVRKREAQAQREFLEGHNLRSEVDQAGQ